MPSQGAQKSGSFAGPMDQSNLRYRIRAAALMWWFVLYASTGLANPAFETDPKISDLCDRAAMTASRASGVPLDVLQAITRVETGRGKGGRLRPWPWAVNMEGTGRWFETLNEARSYVFSHFNRGARSFDIGCFQINYKWHSPAFRSIDDMFDPYLNAKYAAEFLATLYQEFGNWPDAAGAYHSRTPQFATNYATRFVQVRDQMPDIAKVMSASWTGGQRSPLGDARTQHAGVATKPLFPPGGSVALGSLVPISRLSTETSNPFVVLN